MAGPTIRPYEPLTCVTGVGNIESYEVTAAGAGQATILPADPNRVFALIYIGSGSVLITPFSNQTTYGNHIAKVGGDESLLIHSASYPGLAQREWYGYFAGPGSVMVVSVSAKG